MQAGLGIAAGADYKVCSCFRVFAETARVFDRSEGACGNGAAPAGARQFPRDDAVSAKKKARGERR